MPLVPISLPIGTSREDTVAVIRRYLVAFLVGLALTVATKVALADCGTPSVRFLKSEPIAVSSEGFSEPSGLSMTDDGKHFLSVSDDSAALFLLDQEGTLRQPQGIALKKPDLEGVALDLSGNRILAVNEGAFAIVVIDVTSGELDQLPLSDMVGYNAVKQSFKTSDPNDGLEGIAVDAERGRVFVLKEKAPRLLLEISMDLKEILRATELTPALGFVDDDQSDKHLDVSGLTVDGSTGCLWIVSDRAERLFLFDPEGNGETHSFALGWLDGKKPRDIPHAEGIAHDPRAERLYIVNDDGKASRLFTFEILRSGAGQ